MQIQHTMLGRGNPDQIQPNGMHLLITLYADHLPNNISQTSVL